MNKDMNADMDVRFLASHIVWRPGFRVWYWCSEDNGFYDGGEIDFLIVKHGEEPAGYYECVTVSFHQIGESGVTHDVREHRNCLGILPSSETRPTVGMLERYRAKLAAASVGTPFFDGVLTARKENYEQRTNR